jgi:septum formation protein
VLTAIAVPKASAASRRGAQSAFSPDQPRRSYGLLGQWRTAGQGRRLCIQGLGAVFVAGLNGSYSAVVGLPVCETAELLGHFGIPCWQNLNAQ